MKRRSLLGDAGRIISISAIIIILFGVICYLVLLLPPVQSFVVNLAERKFSEYLNTDISIGKVRANLISTLELFDIKVRDENRPDDSIAVGHVRIRYNIAALLKKTISIPRVRIENVYASVSVSPDRTYHIPGVPKSVWVDSETSDEPAKTNSPSWNINLGRVRIRNFNGTYNDSSLQMRGEINNAQMSARFFRIDSMLLNLKVPQGYYRSPWWTGAVDTIGASATLQFDGMDLIDSYVEG